MDRRQHVIWLIPVLIIGLSCLLFLFLLFNSRKKDAADTGMNGTPAAAEDTVTVSGDETERDDEAGILDHAPEKPETEKLSALDESFYDDPDEDEKAENHGYVLLLTSSESDLKIQMVDSLGDSPSGMNWTASVTKKDDPAGGFEASDDDGDGVIYLDEMAPGEYSVEVTNGSGIVETSSINIKPRIRYTASSGIRSIVMQEKDIDVSSEDTAFSPEEREEEPDTRDEGVPEAASLPKGSLGIDVSKYNKDIDWERVRASGIEFAIIRAGYRGSGTGVLVEDPYFRQNLAGAKAAGMKIGVYFFTQAISTEEAKEEAEAVASLVNAADLSLPVFLDVESSANSNGGRADPLDPLTRTGIVRAFCEECENLGYSAGVYANKTWMTGKLIMSELSPYTKWLAQYRAAGPTYDGDYSIWQYTSSGTVDGITGRVDLDIYLY
ncbi:MAG: glycoside hydrolase family 25 protein [Lachnospiraceae bacterium]|nr:glycoside hydrolase family 25 protein [Lachnospiraceae bacterium]